jgi:hypothetical protein
MCAGTRGGDVCSLCQLTNRLYRVGRCFVVLKGCALRILEHVLGCSFVFMILLIHGD